MEFHRSNRARFIFSLLAFFIFSAASGKSRDSKKKDDAGWNISDSSGDDGFVETDNGDEAHTRFKGDSDDTYEDDPDSSRDPMKSKFKDGPDGDDTETDTADEGQDEDP